MVNQPKDIIVRASTEDDEHLAPIAAGLIEEASKDFDIARREVDFLASKIRSGRAALALLGKKLIGFGYWSDWEDGKFLSHSGLVVIPAMRGHGLGRHLKAVLFETSKARRPDAVLMSLTTSPTVRAYNEALGFKPCSLDDLTDDPAFWEGCKACRNYAEVQAKGLRCCCEAMILRPDAAPDAAPGDAPR